MSTVTIGSRNAIPVAGPTPRVAPEAPPDKGAGWILFAGIMFALAAILNIVWGIAAIAGSGFFVAGADYILITNLATWGWIAVGFGALEILAALSIWRGGEFGRWFGIVVGGLAVVGALMSLPAAPFWSLTLVVLYVLVIYGLAVYGGRPELAS